MKRASIVIGGTLGALGLLLAGCSSTSSTQSVEESTPATPKVEAAASNASYSIAPTGTVKMGMMTAKIKGGSINGSTGTISLSTLLGTYVGDITNATVSPTSLTATISLSGTTGTGTLPGTNYVYSGTVSSGSSTFVVAGLTLQPSAAAGAPAPANGNYAVKATGTVTVAGTSANIKGGSISGATGTINLRYSIITITADVTNAVITPTSFAGTITCSLGGGSGTLTGTNYVYSGTVSSGGNTVTVTNLTLQPTT